MEKLNWEESTSIKILKILVPTMGTMTSNKAYTSPLNYFHFYMCDQAWKFAFNLQDLLHILLPKLYSASLKK